MIPASLNTMMIGSVPNRVLDDFPNSTMALSTRLMRTSYTGPLAYLQQASTAGTLVYPDADGNFNRQTVINFFGSNEARVRDWYGQNDITTFSYANNGNYALEPLCYDGSGVFKTENGNVALNFDLKIMDFRNALNSIISFSVSGSFMMFFATRKLANNTTTNGFLVGSNNSSGVANSFIVCAGSGITGFAEQRTLSFSGVAGNGSYVLDTNNIYDIYCFYRNASGRVQIRKNGIELNETNWDLAGNGNLAFLGRYRDGASSATWSNASCGEINYYAFYDANYITGVEANMKAYWGTP